ncbi:protein FAM136A-like [Teleopsis dalmanni]|uniref:protein FAM136A-like n=1 Tax=Teleopsis dalmanni TaxID=139649 RepID=UPI0018CD8488|nr:protein FAM136A-like [Teleopsis dalmanni]
MLELQRKRVERALAGMVDKLYKSNLRQLQMEMHVCSAKCCEDENGSIDSVSKCIEKCTRPLVRAQEYLQSEFVEFQTQLQSCVAECNVSNHGNAAKFMDEAELEKFRARFEKCATKCVDKQLSLIPTMLKTMETVLSNGPNNLKRA